MLRLEVVGWPHRVVLQHLLPALGRPRGHHHPFHQSMGRVLGLDGRQLGGPPRVTAKIFLGFAVGLDRGLDLCSELAGRETDQDFVPMDQVVAGLRPQWPGGIRALRVGEEDGGRLEVTSHLQVVDLLNASGMDVSKEQVEVVCTHEGWKEERTME